MPIPSDDDHKRANERQDEAITALVAAVLSEPPEPQSPRYSDAIYEAAWKLVEACKVVQANYDYRITDLDEYKAEIERLNARLVELTKHHEKDSPRGIFY